MQEAIDKLMERPSKRVKQMDVARWLTLYYSLKEKQQIIKARLSVTGLNHASPTDDNSLQDAENYFTQKYEQ